MACLFCGFASGKKREHENGHPFMKLKETKNTLSFLSIDEPYHEEGHTLIIPKKHHKNFEDIPAKVRAELVEHAVKICKALRKRHGGCNFLLNNGRAADQYVPHCHLHVIPRDKKDHIKIEQWRRKPMSLKRFQELTLKMRKLIS
ncbi:hypothetical protein CMO91_00370 [Candidatus Woesearchaeota archaeon]|nr:hypothetical protein [Candidatus Woesearchaeota archaeon]|tara:strand:- start:669 stop:1103 length:435 start_codon:yes stop_codon:yes gene_type:complete